MNAPHGTAHDPELEQLARAAGERLRESAEGLDARTRSRLTQARHAALAQAGQGNALARWLGLAGLQRGWQRWLPAGALAASVLLAALLVVRMPGAGHVQPVAGPFEDTELLADADGLALAQEAGQEPDQQGDGDFDFYAWAVDAETQASSSAVGT
ncbi:MAG: hypothetical protein RL684_1467 [Pseudomonadota bacterium]